MELELEHSTLAAHAQQLQRCLLWDPLTGTQGESKQEFVEALTAVAALPSDSISMEVRRLLVTCPAQAQQHLKNVVAALQTRDVQLKCKAANAVGSLCISRVAGQQLLDQFGDEILKSVSKMATTKNQWAQGDAFFVLGWMAVIADEEMLKKIGQLLPKVVKCLQRNFKLLGEVGSGEKTANQTTAALASSEQASNFRVYGLVLLLNCSQRHGAVFEEFLESVLSMVKELVGKLLESVTCLAAESDDKKAHFEAFEFAELVRLAVTLLSVLVGQLEASVALLLEIKILPLLLKLKQVLGSDQVHEFIGDTEDIAEILEALVETLLTR